MRYVLSLAALLVAGQLAAQQSTTTPAQPSDPSIRTSTPGDQTDVDRTRTYAATDAQQHKQHKAFRASKLIGSEVRNRANEDLGTINDLVINPQDGRVEYVAVSMGGFLGVGDKLFAVPFDALECRMVDGEHVAMLDIHKEAMQNAQGFNEENWPDMANERWRSENDRPYQSLRSRTHQTLKPVDQQPGQQPGQHRSANEGAQPQPTQPQQQ